LNISAVVPTHNRHQSVEKLARFLNDSGCETIVVDDCSNPPVRIDGVIVVRNSKNMKASYSFNRGASLATRDWLLLLNDDMEPGPNFFSDLEPIMARAEAIGFAIKGHTAMGRARIRTDSRGIPARMANIAFGVDMVPGGHLGFAPAAMLIRRGLFMDVGGFDYHTFVGNGFREESDLQIRFRRAGARVYYAECPYLIHLPSAGGYGKITAPGWYYHARNQTIFVLRYYGLLRFWMVTTYLGYLITLGANPFELIKGVAAGLTGASRE
jgi:GT2 family glycosyltransferase